MKAKINSLVDLMTALNSPSPVNLEIQTSILCPYSIVLPVGFSLTGTDQQKSIISFNNGDGIGLTANNEVANLTIQTSPNNRAIYTLSNHPDLGTLSLKNLTISGQLQILTRAGTKNTKLIADQVDIVACDARRYCEQPQKYGVNVFQGAFTVYNFNSDPDSTIHATLTNISLGRKGAPVIGSGLFVCGFGDNGGWVLADTITTGDIYSNGMLPYGQPDMITAGVFIVNGTKIKNITHHGSVTTYGVNDMVLDTWGYVEKWLAEKPITSYGPSGIGFVNFGTVDEFEAKDKVETFSVKAGGEIKQLKISGGIKTYGDKVHSYHVEGGIVHQLHIKGDIEAEGEDSFAVMVTDQGETPLSNISAVSKHGVAVQISGGKITDRSALSAKGKKGDIKKST